MDLKKQPILPNLWICFTNLIALLDLLLCLRTNLVELLSSETTTGLLKPACSFGALFRRCLAPSPGIFDLDCQYQCHQWVTYTRQLNLPMVATPHHIIVPFSFFTDKSVEITGKFSLPHLFAKFGMQASLLGWGLYVFIIFWSPGSLGTKLATLSHFQAGTKTGSHGVLLYYRAQALLKEGTRGAQKSIYPS